jgi:hypothetical protein
MKLSKIGKSLTLTLFLTLLSVVIYSGGKAEAATVSLMFEPSRVSVQKGESFTVDLVLDSGGLTVAGVGTRIRYDPAVLAVEKAQVGEIFDSYLDPEFDPQDGRVYISGVAGSPDKQFQGKGVFASVTFVVLEEGKHTVEIDYDAGSTTDSNVAVMGEQEDALQKVNSLTVNAGNPGDSSLSRTTGFIIIFITVAGVVLFLILKKILLRRSL